jgi:hypothetical protein
MKLPSSFTTISLILFFFAHHKKNKLGPKDESLTIEGRLLE